MDTRTDAESDVLKAADAWYETYILGPGNEGGKWENATALRDAVARLRAERAGAILGPVTGPKAMTDLARLTREVVRACRWCVVRLPILHHFKWWRRANGGYWGRVNGLMWGKRWIPLPNTTREYDEKWNR